MKKIPFRAYGDMGEKPFLFTPFYAEHSLFDKVLKKDTRKFSKIANLVLTYAGKLCIMSQENFRFSCISLMRGEGL